MQAPTNPLFVCDPVINSFPLSDRLHMGDTTISHLVRTRRRAIDARNHRTGIQWICRFVAEEGLINTTEEGMICAE